ncbi:nucleotide-binding alpha-beta plait domain-containing protein [Tanacetum coccineum]
MVAISKEEEVQKISTSIFVTNFPDHAKAKDLWNVCKQYGQVVDAFIPDRKSKAGKRYGFVRFIRVYDVDRLVSNLCTLWMGSHHLHANVARFQRPPAVNSGGYTHQNGNYVPKKTEANSNNGRRTDKRSYVNVVNGDTKSTEACEPALLLDESCLNQLDYSLGLLGKVKEFSSFDNMRMVLGNEGFDDIDLRYMGGMWIMIGFKTEDTKAKFQSCLGATSWFSLLIQASKEFVIDERITWVDIEGIPLKLWSESTFNRIAAKWGKMLYLEKLDEGCLYSKRLCILTTGKSNILETFKIIHKGKRFSVRAKETMGWIPDFDEQEEDNSESEDEQSVGFIKEDFDGSDENEGDNNLYGSRPVKEDVNVQAEEKGNDFDVNNSLDPFELYSLLNKKRNVEEKMDKSNETVSIPFPPGFTPCDETESYVIKVNGFEIDGFEEMISKAWCECPIVEVNPMLYLMYKMKFLKKCIREWNGKRQSNKCKKRAFKKDLHDLEIVIDQGNATDDILYKRMEIIKDIQEAEKVDNLEAAQKAKIKWAIEGDENTKFYHGILNKKRNQLGIRGVLKDGMWIDNPAVVKKEFLEHFSTRFQQPRRIQPVINIDFPRTISELKKNELEGDISYQEIKRAVWDCGIDKSPGPDGVTFGFIRRYWSLIEKDVVAARTDIQKESQKRPNQARDGKDKVNPKPKSVKVKSQPHEENTT